MDCCVAIWLVGVVLRIFYYYFFGYFNDLRLCEIILCKIILVKIVCNNNINHWRTSKIRSGMTLKKVCPPVLCTFSASELCIYYFHILALSGTLWMLSAYQCNHALTTKLVCLATKLIQMQIGAISLKPLQQFVAKV